MALGRSGRKRIGGDAFRCERGYALDCSKEDVDLPWQVVVHNDPVNLMTYVTMVFQRVFGYPREKAERHMLEVHQKGRSILWSGMRERAELYVQQLHGYLLLATLEKVS